MPRIDGLLTIIVTLPGHVIQTVDAGLPAGHLISLLSITTDERTYDKSGTNNFRSISSTVEVSTGTLHTLPGVVVTVYHCYFSSEYLPSRSSYSYDKTI